MTCSIKDIDLKKPLIEYCRNVTNIEGDTFVGIKSELSNDKHEITINFPIGYRLPKIEEEANQDIINLIEVLQSNINDEDKIDRVSNTHGLKMVKFPINSYFIVISDYLARGSYYQEIEEVYVKKTTGRANIKQTIRKITPNIQDNGFIYTDFMVNSKTYTDKEEITRISWYCIYESLSKLGWMYRLPLIEKPHFDNENRYFQRVLENKIRRVNSDKKKLLFSSMIDVLDYRDNADNPEEFYFGTNNFEYIWEKLIDKTFGIKNKQDYFPRTSWQLRYGDKDKKNFSLEPDTIMIYNDNVYVLDAKYYKYGITGLPNHLPNSSSISKQITYAEYISENKKFKEKLNNKNIYNAFLMPYSKENSLFKVDDKEKNYLNIGKALSEWKSNEKIYENIQGILVDIKDLMKNNISLPDKELMRLSAEIEKYRLGGVAK
jgi:type II restriction-modification system restriction subunit